MGNKPTRSIAMRLQAISTLIRNSQNDPEILALVSTYGYDISRLQEGAALHAQAVAAVNAQAVAAGAQRSATLRAGAAELQARANYAALARVARALFAPGSGERKALGLQGTTPRVAEAFIAAATKLYDNALGIADIRDTLVSYGYNQQRLTAERDAAQAFAQARQGQIVAMGTAVEATAAQNAAIGATMRWAARYRAIVMTALRHNPQLRERLGLPLRSSAPQRRPAPAPMPAP